MKGITGTYEHHVFLTLTVCRTYKIKYRNILTNGTCQCKIKRKKAKSEPQNMNKIWTTHCWYTCCWCLCSQAKRKAHKERQNKAKNKLVTLISSKDQSVEKSLRSHVSVFNTFIRSGNTDGIAEILGKGLKGTISCIDRIKTAAQRGKICGQFQHI